MKKLRLIMPVLLVAFLTSACGAGSSQQTGSVSDSSSGSSSISDADTVGIEHDPLYLFNYPLNPKMYGFTGELMQYVGGDDSFIKWTEGFAQLDGSRGDRPFEDLNLKTLIEEFQISKENAAKILMNANGNSRFTSKEMDVLYSDDKELFDQTFRNPYTVLKDGKIYTCKILTEMSIQELRSDGITAQMVRDACYFFDDPRELYWQSIFEKEQVDAIKSIIDALEV